MNAAASGVLHNIGQLMSAEKANALAAKLMAEDTDGWTYVAVHPQDGKGYSFVNTYDEDGLLLGKI